MTAATRTAVHDSLHGLQPAWTELADASGCVFSTWEWLGCWWRHFGRNRPLRLASWSEADGRVCGIIPMYLAARRPVRVVRLMGHGPSDQLGPVCPPASRRPAATVWAGVLRSEIDDWDVLFADEVPGSTDWSRAMGGVPLARQANPVARLHTAGWPEWIGDRSRNFRSTLVRARRRLDSYGTVRYRTTVDPERIDADLAEMMRLHVLRWKGTGSRGGFAGREPFHREFCRIAFDRDWLRLRFLEVDGRPVAALYNLRFGPSESFYLSGRDPAVGKASVGLLVHAYAIRMAHEEGSVEYRFLRGAESYKYRFADDDEPLDTFAVTRGRAGRTAVRALRDLPRFPSWARRRMPSAFAWGTGVAPLWGPP